jgi:hypothetical protein
MIVLDAIRWSVSLSPMFLGETLLGPMVVAPPTTGGPFYCLYTLTHWSLIGRHDSTPLLPEEPPFRVAGLSDGWGYWLQVIWVRVRGFNSGIRFRKHFVLLASFFFLQEAPAQKSPSERKRRGEGF